MTGTDPIRMDELLTDEAILQELGARLTRYRIDANMTQAELAEQAGLSKRTVERVEAGDSSQTLSLIRVLRVLGLLSGLEAAVPPAVPGPMELLQRQGKPRQRARSRRSKADKDVAEPSTWTWGDES